MNNKNKSYHFDVKIIVLLLSVFGCLFIIGNKFMIHTQARQVSVYFLDTVPKHTRRWIGGVKELSPATWSAHILFEGKNVVCDIPSPLYFMFKNTSNINRFGLLHYHYALFSDEIICEQLDPIFK